MSTAHEPPGPLFSAAWKGREAFIARFEAAWLAGERPALTDYLPEDPDDRRAVLIELIHADLEFRWQAGETPSVESYLARYPELAADAAVKQDLLAALAELRAARSSLTAGGVSSLDPTASWKPTTPLRRRRLRAAANPTTELPAVSGYEVLRVLGRGGMGVVYLARHLRLNRLVALKMIVSGSHAGPQEHDRFTTEARAVAAVQHVNVVQVFEVGQHQGLPYMALEYVAGGSLHERLKRGLPQPHDAAWLVEQLAHGVAAAHARAIIHRDLKPQNVLLAAAAADVPLRQCVAKVTDFGLAKQVEGGDLTQTGSVLGTPPYMAPEQARGEPRHVGFAADVYALGAILYECLTGRPPFQGPTGWETVNLVMFAEPVGVRQLQPGVPRDLETICMTCLRKEPARRYAAAADLAEDLRRFQAGEPIRAHPVGRLERVRKWARRRPALAALLVVSAVALLAVVGAAVALVYSQDLEAARRDAVTALHETEQARAAEKGALSREQAAREQREAALAEARRHLYANRVGHAAYAWRDNEALGALLQLEACEPDQRGWEWHYLNRLCRGSHPGFKQHKGHVNAVVFSPDGKRLASAGLDRTVRVWDAESGAERFRLPGHTDQVMSLTFSKDGQRLASASLDRTVRVWDAVKGRLLSVEKDYGGLVRAVAYHPKEEWLASASSGPGVRVRGRGVKTWTVNGVPYQDVAFSPNGEWLAGASSREVRIWDARTGVQRLAFKDPNAGFTRVCFSPDSQRLASAAVAEPPKVWDARTGKELLVLRGHEGEVSGVCYSPDGKRLATAGRDRTVKVWDAVSGRELLSLKGHSAGVLAVAFSPDGERLASAALDGTVRLWDADADPEALTLRNLGSAAAVAFTPDGRHVAVVDRQPLVKLLDVRNGNVTRSFPRQAEPLLAVALSSDGRHLAAAVGKTVKVWDARTGQETHSLEGHKELIQVIAFGPSSEWLVSGAADKMVKVWSLQTGRELLTLREHATAVAGLSCTPDGRHVASASQGVVKIWEARTGRVTRTLAGDPGALARVVFSPDGKRLATNQRDLVKVWEVGTGREVLTLRGHVGGVLGICFSHDGKRLATGGEGKTVKLWDTQVGEELITLKGHLGVVHAVCFGPDDRRLASASMDQTVKVWDATPLGR